MQRFRSLNRPRSPWALLPALLLGAPITGCDPGTSEVSGAVHYNGQPLPFGTIQFLGRDGIPCAGKIQPDGTFSVWAPVGEAKVIVSCVDEAQLTRHTSQLMGSRGRAAPPDRSSADYSLIPACYADWDASGLTVLVRRGGTRQDFALISR